MNLSPLWMCVRRQMLLAGFLVLPSFADADPVDDLTVVNRYVAAWNAHDPDAAVSLFAPDAVYYNSSTETTEKVRETVGEVLRGLLGVLPDLRWTMIGQPVAGSSGVAFEWEVSGFSKPAGNAGAVPLHIRGVSVFRIGDGRITYLADYYDGDSLRRQLDR